MRKKNLEEYQDKIDRMGKNLAFTRNLKKASVSGAS